MRKMWEINRFELAYFDGVKNQWQLFGECPETPSNQSNEIYSYHRTLVQELLVRIRELFNEALNGLGINIAKFKLKEKNSVNDNITITLDLSKLSYRESTVKDFSDTVTKDLDTEGLCEESKNKIKDFFNKLNSHAASNGGKFTYTFDKANYIYDLISLLPIEKDWDVMGIPYTNDPVYFLNSIDWKEVIFSEVIFSQVKLELVNISNEKSIKFLGSSVDLKICKNDKEEVKGDYFGFCCNNIDKEPSKVERYKIYGTIVDSLQQAIYGIKGNTASSYYMVAYPIFILNSLHYIHIFITHDSNSSTLQELRNNWLEVHNQLNWSSLRPIITYILEQISSFTFQDRMLYFIRHPDKYKINILDDNCIKDIFKDNIACLIPDKPKSYQAGKCIIQNGSYSFNISYSIPSWWNINNQFEKLIIGQIGLASRHQWRWLQDTVGELREIIKHGTKSAVLSIDVRNLSHNIGSHVLAYWIQKLNQLLQDCSSDNGKLQTAINKSKALFRYIQHRADFLAEVATSIPCSEMSFDLKKDILNPFLNDDNDSGNQYRKSNLKDGITLDSNVYVLLRYIAESEGITINFEGEQNNGKPGKATTKIITCEIDDSLKENSKEKPVWVSIPSGIIGKHAIYSILENFIRNAAKHYKGTEKNTTDFININMSKADGNYKDDYIKIEITDIRENSCELKYVKDLNGYIEGGFVDEQGRLKSGGWGIKEMLVSANFLRKNTPEDLYDIITNRKPCNPPLLKTICPSNGGITGNLSLATDCNNCNHGKKLGIRFYLKRPKHLAVMVDNINDNITPTDFFERKKITADEFKDKPIPHNILLVDGKTYNEKYKDKDDPLAPCRVMDYNKNKPNDGKITDKYYLCRYEKFIREEIYDFNKMKMVNDLYADYKFAETEFSINAFNNANGNNAEGNIVFKDHPENESINDLFVKSKYFQPMSGGYSTKAKFYKNRELPELIRKHFYLELIESALTKVVIVDERISEWAGKEAKYWYCLGGVKQKLTVREMLKKMNVYVAEINKENITDNELKSKSLSSETLVCKVFDSNKKNNAHFFVIHQGILDKLKDKGNDFMKEIKCRWKVIDSGRGVPEEMEHRFVQISALQTLLENYDKHGLVQTLFSLRKPVKGGQSGNQGW